MTINNVIKCFKNDHVSIILKKLRFSRKFRLIFLPDFKSCDKRTQNGNDFLHVSLKLGETERRFCNFK